MLHRIRSYDPAHNLDTHVPFQKFNSLLSNRYLQKAHQVPLALQEGAVQQKMYVPLLP